MSWTTPKDLRDQVEKLWTKGRILSDIAGEGCLFPLSLRLAGPDSREWSTRFEEARLWAKSLEQLGHAVAVKERRRHPSLGDNDFPVRVVVETRGDALAWIGKLEEAKRYEELVVQVRQRCPAVLPWVSCHPLDALHLAPVWSRLLDVVEWYQAHPRPGIFLREIDLSGIDTKFLEAHRSLLSAWFLLVQETPGVQEDRSDARSFEERFGFREKPLRIRFRFLDPADVPDAYGAATDIELDSEAFARWVPPNIETVFVLENEITFLAFPSVPRSLAIFGSGYGFEGLGKAQWLRDRDVRYWGDLDTHGFAILDEFRRHFPDARSFLMDRATLLSHRDRWTREPKPSRWVLQRLLPHELEVYEGLVGGAFGESVRLEQERIGMKRVLAALELATRITNLDAAMAIVP